MKEQLQKIKEQAAAELSALTDGKALEDLRVKFLGKKGELTAILKQMGKLSAEERPVFSSNPSSCFISAKSELCQIIPIPPKRQYICII